MRRLTALEGTQVVTRTGHEQAEKVWEKLELCDPSTCCSNQKSLSQFQASSSWLTEVCILFPRQKRQPSLTDIETNLPQNRQQLPGSVAKFILRVLNILHDPVIHFPQGLCPGADTLHELLAGLIARCSSCTSYSFS